MWARVLLFLVLVSALASAQTGPESINYCSNPSKTAWQRYACDVVALSLQSPGCLPQRFYPNGGSASSPARGLVVMFHGYTACPVSYNDLSLRLQSEGFYVLSFLNVGHGRTYADCKRQGADCVDNYPIEGLPVNHQGYADFVDSANGIVKDELSRIIKQTGVKFDVTVIGHSLGGSLATLAAARGNGMYTRMVLNAPFFGLSLPNIDSQVTTCAVDFTSCLETVIRDAFRLRPNQLLSPDVMETAKKIFNEFLSKLGVTPAEIVGGYGEINSILRWALVQVSTHFGSFPSVSKFVDQGMGWGAQCENDRINITTLRAGICSFRVKNILAVHAVGQLALKEAVNIRGVTTQFIGVERDGSTRNAMSFQMLQTAFNNKNPVTACIYRVTDGCDPNSPGNICGVPHAFVAEADNLNLAPYYMYWTKTWLDETTAFIKAERTQVGSANWNNDRNICVIQDAFKPDLRLVAPVPRRTDVTLRGPMTLFTERVQRAFLDKMFRAMGFSDSWRAAILSFDLPFTNAQTNNQLQASRFKLNADDSFTVSMELPESVTNELVFLAQKGQLQPIEQFSVMSVMVNGAGVVVPPSSSAVSLVASLALILNCVLLLVIMI
eukprot:TRINITY_DN5741_c0_g1_i2.p1 TRINITY_DN5741_c0_g1~~TRINITY_DN5741_c0_g1_i2.p1  ORF type:complete len:609 (-),score=185.59 TRINITY_DN5741_c0_g1_i2:19-1845(-)